jgi:hypothetical protein
MLLQKDFALHKSWVAKAYIELNKALDNQDYQMVEHIGYEAFKRMTK